MCRTTNQQFLYQNIGSIFGIDWPCLVFTVICTCYILFQLPSCCAGAIIQIRTSTSIWLLIQVSLGWSKDTQKFKSLIPEFCHGGQNRFQAISILLWQIRGTSQATLQSCQLDAMDQINLLLQLDQHPNSLLQGQAVNTSFLLVRSRIEYPKPRRQMTMAEAGHRE